MESMFAIDPGTVESAWCEFDGERVLSSAKEPNEQVLSRLRELPIQPVAIEMVASYGMPVGREVFETVLWTGRFYEALRHNGLAPGLTYRLAVKIHLCGTAKAKDANIRQAIIDRFPGTGGGAIPQIGTKKQPGPLYGVSGDIWAALAVAIYNWDLLSAV